MGTVKLRVWPRTKKAVGMNVRGCQDFLRQKSSVTMTWRLKSIEFFRILVSCDGIYYTENVKFPA